MSYVIGIDLGTSGTKTVLFDENGVSVCSALEEYPLYQPQNGWAEQNPKDWWNAVVNTLSSVVSKSGISSDNIVGIGLSGQMHGLVMLDADNNVIRKSIIWCDQRTSVECDEIENSIGKERLIEITANPALTGFTASKILWVRKNEPENFSKCAHILLPKDYIRFMLTGEYATDVSDASGMQLLDIKNRCWSDELLEKLNIDKTLLGKVYESPEITGRISDFAAELTGLKAGTIVVAGAGDNAAAAVGTGIVSDGKAFVTIGTSGVVYAHTDEMTIDPKGRVHTFCCAVPGKWHVMGVTQSAGLSLKWFAQECCEYEKNKELETGIDRYITMDAEAEKSIAGSNRLIYLPYLMGERTPHLDPDARGMFFGLSASHNRGDMIRAVLEGVAFSLRDCLEILNGMGVCSEKIVACGGGAKSKLWNQIIAGVFNRSIEKITSTEGAALGAAILACVGSGIYGSVEDACQKMIRVKSKTYPDKSDTKTYNSLYKIYNQIYPSVKDLYKKLKEI